ncbi:MAG: hypothetical protein OXP36_11195, partial [Gammaproteobacteria bacterium]|nr:hypothetical protein [Gammaproteobacteria bacterium]
MLSWDDYSDDVVHARAVGATIPVDEPPVVEQRLVEREDRPAMLSERAPSNGVPANGALPAVHEHPPTPEPELVAPRVAPVPEVALPNPPPVTVATAPAVKEASPDGAVAAAPVETTAAPAGTAPSQAVRDAVAA